MTSLSKLMAALMLFSATSAVAAENWPKVTLPDETNSILDNRARERAETPLSHYGYITDHSPFGDYLNLGAGTCDESASIKKDAKGVAMRVIDGKAYYHPVISAQCGLRAFGRYLRGTEDSSEAINYVERLLSLQAETGGFSYPFEYQYYLTKEMLPVGWTSALAQGQAISLFARVYMLTGDRRYLDSGKRAMRYIAVPVDQGGVATTMADLDPSLNGYIFFDEYVSKPENYTLNGFMFTLLGLYDWASLPSDIDADQEVARDLFDRGVKTLEKILPYYDLGRWSAYDLGYITFKAKPEISNFYHGVHIYLLHALRSVTGSEVLRAYEKKWTSYLTNEE